MSIVPCANSFICRALAIGERGEAICRMCTVRFGCVIRMGWRREGCFMCGVRGGLYDQPRCAHMLCRECWWPRYGWPAWRKHRKNKPYETFAACPACDLYGDDEAEHDDNQYDAEYEECQCIDAARSTVDSPTVDPAVDDIGRN
jgi:hypothetical protein